jgi:hypothetical protein
MPNPVEGRGARAYGLLWLACHFSSCHTVFFSGASGCFHSLKHKEINQSHHPQAEQKGVRLQVANLD